MSVSATTDVGGFIGNSYANVNLYSVQNGENGTTKTITTSGSSTDQNADGVIGFMTTGKLTLSTTLYVYNYMDITAVYRATAIYSWRYYW